MLAQRIERSTWRKWTMTSWGAFATRGKRGTIRETTSSRRWSKGYSIHDNASCAHRWKNHKTN
jgi:hypothetical protein